MAKKTQKLPAPKKQNNSDAQSVVVRTDSKPKAFDVTLSHAQRMALKRSANAKKIDWNKAYAWYLGDASRTYEDVAKEFNVSKRSVEINATVLDGNGGWDTWAELRLKLGEQAKKATEDAYKKSIPAREEQHLIHYRNLQIATGVKINLLAHQGDWLTNSTTGKKVKVQEFSARELADAAKALKLSIDGERVILGLSTSVSTIKPGENEKGQGWGEILTMAMNRVAEADKNDESQS